MNIASTIRISRIFLLITLIMFCSALQAQPAGGKWAAASQLPLLDGRMVFADSLVGYYIGQDTGYVTKTGGLTWKEMTFPSNARPAPTYLSAPDHNTIIAYQHYSYDSNGVVFPGIIKSVDQGVTWELVSTAPVPTNIHAFTMWTATDGFRIWQDDATQKEVCAVTHDGGLSFTDIRGDATLQKYISQIPNNAISIKSDWGDQLHGVIAVSGNVASKAYPVLLTSDGGKSWSEQYLKHKGDSTVKLSYPYMYPGSNSIWVQPSVPKVAQYYYYSSDFGKTWITSDTIKSGYISKLAPVSPTAAWAFIVSSLNFVSGTSNVIAYKDISGKWTYADTVRGQSFKTPLTIEDLEFVDSLHGFVRASFQPGTDTVDHDPNAHFFRFATSIPNSVGAPSDIAHLRCVPNPASSFVKVEGLSGDETVLNVKLTSALGKPAAGGLEKNGAETSLDIRLQPNGCYFVMITTSLRTEIIPIIIMHY